MHSLFSEPCNEPGLKQPWGEGKEGRILTSISCAEKYPLNWPFVKKINESLSVHSYFVAVIKIFS